MKNLDLPTWSACRTSIKTATSLLAVFAITSLLSGCGNSSSVADSKLVGKWELDVESYTEFLTKLDKRRGRRSGGQHQRLADMLAKSRMVLNFKKDGTVVTENHTDSGTTEQEGEWSIVSEKGSKTTIDFVSDKGKAEEKVITFIDADTIEIAGFNIGMPGVRVTAPTRFNRVD